MAGKVTLSVLTALMLAGCVTNPKASEATPTSTPLPNLAAALCVRLR